ncbi:MAG: Ig domain-containing protein [Sarcina sp.]|nr:Ig domain-containing protein [Sarcina sp.]
MNKVKNRLALLLAAILIAGSLREPVFAVSNGSAGAARGASAEIGLEDPAQVTETKPLDLVPDGGEPEEPGPSQEKIEVITLDKASLNLYAGASGKLTAVVEPADATDPSVSWKSSDTKVATVDQKGQVKAVAKGTATITATANDGSNVNASCTVTVRQPVTGVSLNRTSMALYKGRTFTLKAALAPSDAYNKKVNWKFSNTAIATVTSAGVVRGIKKGTVTITATAADGSKKYASCKVTVRQPVTNVKLNKTTLTLNRGRSFTLKATLAPSDAYNKKVNWKSNNTAVATVTSAGVVKGIKKGTATITATAADGSKKYASCKVTVRQPVTSVKLNKTALTLNRGRSFTLKATAAPSNANNKNVRWTTSNKAVATVTSKGVVKGIKKGTVTITATAADGSGKKATCRITVK